MQKPIIPENESERVKSLIELNILDTPVTQSFERLTRITKVLFNVPMVTITLIDSERQWFKSKQGLDYCETSRDLSICAHAINQDDIFIINDTLLDSRFFDHPAVVGEPNIRFYAGYPILSPLGYKIGTICIMDTKPRVFDGERLSCLKDIGWLVEGEIVAIKNNFHQKRVVQALKEENPSQLIDSLTQLWNQHGIEKLFIEHAEFCKIHQEDFGIGIISIDNFKLITDKHGHFVAEAVLRAVGNRVLSACRESDFVGRWGDTEFLAIINGSHPEELMNVAERLRKNVCDRMISYQDILLPVSVTVRLCIFHPKNSFTLKDIVNDLHTALDKNKMQVDNQVICNF